MAVNQLPQHEKDVSHIGQVVRRDMLGSTSTEDAPVAPDKDNPLRREHFEEMLRLGDGTRRINVTCVCAAGADPIYEDGVLLLCCRSCGGELPVKVGD